MGNRNTEDGMMQSRMTQNRRVAFAPTFRVFCITSMTGITVRHWVPAVLKDWDRRKSTPSRTRIVPGRSLVILTGNTYVDCINEPTSHPLHRSMNLPGISMPHAGNLAKRHIRQMYRSVLYTPQSFAASGIRNLSSHWPAFAVCPLHSSTSPRARRIIMIARMIEGPNMICLIDPISNLDVSHLLKSWTWNVGRSTMFIAVVPSCCDPAIMCCSLWPMMWEQTKPGGLSTTRKATSLSLEKQSHSPKRKIRFDF